MIADHHHTLPPASSPVRSQARVKKEEADDEDDDEEMAPAKSKYFASGSKVRLRATIHPMHLSDSRLDPTGLCLCGHEEAKEGSHRH